MSDATLSLQGIPRRNPRSGNRSRPHARSWVHVGQLDAGGRRSAEVRQGVRGVGCRAGHHGARVRRGRVPHRRQTRTGGPGRGDARPVRAPGADVVAGQSPRAGRPVRRPGRRDPAARRDRAPDRWFPGGGGYRDHRARGRPGWRRARGGGPVTGGAGSPVQPAAQPGARTDRDGGSRRDRCRAAGGPDGLPVARRVAFPPGHEVPRLDHRRAPGPGEGGTAAAGRCRTARPDGRLTECRTRRHAHRRGALPRRRGDPGRGPCARAGARSVGDPGPADGARRQAHRARTAAAAGGEPGAGRRGRVARATGGRRARTRPAGNRRRPWRTGGEAPAAGSGRGARDGDRRGRRTAQPGRFGRGAGPGPARARPARPRGEARVGGSGPPGALGGRR